MNDKLNRSPACIGVDAERESAELWELIDHRWRQNGSVMFASADWATPAAIVEEDPVLSYVSSATLTATLTATSVTMTAVVPVISSTRIRPIVTRVVPHPRQMPAQTTMSSPAVSVSTTRHRRRTAGSRPRRTTPRARPRVHRQRVRRAVRLRVAQSGSDDPAPPVRALAHRHVLAVRAGEGGLDVAA